MENVHKRCEEMLASPQRVLQVLEGVLRYEERYAAGRMPYDQYTHSPVTRVVKYVPLCSHTVQYPHKQ